jgi:hypothetical protein
MEVLTFKTTFATKPFEKHCPNIQHTLLLPSESHENSTWCCHLRNNNNYILKLSYGLEKHDVTEHCIALKYKQKDNHRKVLGIDPCGGGVEYLHRDPASRKRGRKGKSRIWDSKIWPRVLRDPDPKMTALVKASSNCKRQTRPLVREGAPNQRNPQLSDNNKDLVVSPMRCM